MLAALQAAIDEAAQDAGVRAVVIAAKGTAFCAGHDLKELTAHRGDADGGRAYHAQAHAPVRQADALDRALPQAGDRRRAGHGHRRRLPAGRHLRPGGGCGGGELLHARRQHRPVLLHADGGAVAQRAAQARHGDAAAGRDAAGARRGGVRPRQPRGAGGQADGRGPGARPARSPPSRRRRSPSARRRSTGRSRCRSPRPTTMPPASWSRT